jgi:hypothetical protein
VAAPRAADRRKAYVYLKTATIRMQKFWIYSMKLGAENYLSAHYKWLFFYGLQ